METPKKGDVFECEGFECKGRKVEFICEERGQTYNYPTEPEDLKKLYYRVLKLDATKNTSFQLEKSYFEENYKRRQRNY